MFFYIIKFYIGHILDDTTQMQVKVEIKGRTKEFNIKISKSNEIKDLKRHIFEKKV